MGKSAKRIQLKSGLTKFFQKYLKTFSILVAIIFHITLIAQEDTVPISKVIESIKNNNFTVFTVGILSDGIPQDVINDLVRLQTAPPRQMKIYLTQSYLMKDIFYDFTYLINDKKAQAIIIWPSKLMKDESMMKKISTMSKRKKIPVIALQESWLEYGAMMYIKNPDDLTLVVNEKIREYMNYPIAEKSLYKIVKYPAK
jgi:ABC-type uncharacterized transport system substrate-binding protein